MTPRRAGWVAGGVVFTLLAAVELAQAMARSGAAADDPISGGGVALTLVFRAVPLATGAGVLVAHIAASRRERRAAGVAAAASFMVVGGWVWWLSMISPRAPQEDPGAYALGLLATLVTVGTAIALAAAMVASWVAGKAVGRDGAERVLALETTSLHGSRDRWGAAMRAELASINDPLQRSRFARSAAAVAFRRGTGPWPAVLAALTGVGAGFVVYSAARIALDRPRDRGIIGEPIMGLVIVLLVMAVITGTLIGRSVRAGLETAVLAWLAVYVCSVAVEVPQALAWYHDEGILLLDGEGAALAGVDALAAALQPITHYAFIVISLLQLVVAVLAVALGGLALGVARRFG